MITIYMSKEDCSNNRFETLKESKKNPFVSEKKFEKYEPKNTRWGNLSQDQDEEQSPKNTFQKRRSDFSHNSRDNNSHGGNSRDNNSRGNNSRGNNLYGRHTDRYGNYKGSPFRRETRPKTPPPKKFKMEETDFPPLG